MCSWLQFSLMVTFPEVPLGIFLFCMCVIAIGAVQVGHPSLPAPHGLVLLEHTLSTRVGCVCRLQQESCSRARCRMAAQAPATGGGGRPEVLRAWASRAGLERGPAPSGAWQGEAL